MRMRYWMIALAAVAVPAAVLAQSAWGSFQDGAGSGIGLQGSDGSQLLIKCDKPGKGSVYAMIVAPKRMVPPSAKPVMRPVKFHADSGPVRDDRWRFFDATASAVDTTTEASLKRLFVDLPDAKTLFVTLDPGQMTPTDLSFEVAGARAAIGTVFDACKDVAPLQ